MRRTQSSQERLEYEENRILQAETDSFNDTWLIERDELTQSVLSNRGYDWKEETLRIQSQIEVTMLETVPLVLAAAAANPAILNPSRSQKTRNKIIRKQLNIVILMEMRRQLILDLIN